MGWESMQASHLVIELRRELHTLDVRFVTLKGVEEEVPRKLNKGLVVRDVLDQVQKDDNPVDFILCIGDDISDEKMFTSIFSFVADLGDENRDSLKSLEATAPFNTKVESDSLSKERNYFNNTNIYVYTVTVGRKSSHASYYVQNASDVANVLINMSGLSIPKYICWDNKECNYEMFE